MNQKFIFCITFLVIFCCDISISSAAVENSVGDFDDINKTLTIYDNEFTVMTVRLISAVPDLCTFTEIFEISNYEAYIPDKDNDFKARTITYAGSGVTDIEWFIEQNVSYVVNVSDYGIKQVEEIIYNNKTGKNESILVNKTVIIGYHDETRYKDAWADYQLYDKVMSKDQVQRIKVVYHKVAELGPFYIQTVPMFRGVECPELTWWSGSWDRRREINITTNGTSVPVGYQMQFNITYDSDMQIDFDDLRFTNSSDGELSYWIESKVDSLYVRVWVNLSDAITDPGSDTIWMYYGNADSSSGGNGDDTFLQYHGESTSVYTDSTTISPTNIIYESKIEILSNSIYNIFGMVSADGYLDDNQVLQFVSSTATYIQTRHDGTLTEVGENLGVGIGTYKCKISNNATIVRGYVDGNEIVSGITTNLPIDTLGLFQYQGSPNCKQFWSFVRKYIANEPTYSIGAEEEFVVPTPTPIPAQYDELDLPLILYILTISMLYLLIVFRHGIATVELSLIYLIFVFFFLLFQTITISVNYIYLTLFLLLFLISIAGITKQGVD